MAYANFKIGILTRQFSLIIAEATDLFADVPPAVLRPDFQSQLTRIGPLALRVSTEKARSEFLIAPILAELWLLNDQQIGVLSGVEFDVDEAQGLSGFCDYIITRSPELIFVRAHFDDGRSKERGHEEELRAMYCGDDCRATFQCAGK